MSVTKHCFNNSENQCNSPFDLLLHDITDAPPKYTKLLARPTRVYC